MDVFWMVTLSMGVGAFLTLLGVFIGAAVASPAKEKEKPHDQ